MVILLPSSSDALGELLSFREGGVDSAIASCDSYLLSCLAGEKKGSESRIESQQIQPKYGMSPESNPGLIGGSACSYHFADAMICGGS